MNELYFACTDCKVYLNAGYRWAYWHLVHPGIVAEKQPVDVERVLRAGDYWKPPGDKESAWLIREVLPSVREFLQSHRAHALVFWDENDLPDDAHLDWLQVGYCPAPSARFFAETLGMSTWESVLAWNEANEDSAWQLGYADMIEAYRSAFDRHVRNRGTQT